MLNKGLWNKVLIRVGFRKNTENVKHKKIEKEKPDIPKQVEQNTDELFLM